MIATGDLDGTLDPEKNAYYPKGISIPKPQKQPQKLKVEFRGLTTPDDKDSSYGSKQSTFIKTESRETSQEDFVKLVVNLGYVGSHIRIGIVTHNNSIHKISNVTIKLMFSEKIELFKIKPSLDFKNIDGGISIDFSDIAPNSNKKMNVYFKTNDLGEGIINGQLQYVNHEDYVRFIRIEDMYYNLNPPDISAKKLDPSQIESFTNKVGIKRDIRSYGLPDGLFPAVAFTYINQIISSFNFEKITAMENDDNLVCWYFAETVNKEFEILVVGQIVNKKIEFYASSMNEQIISSLLTAFSIRLKKRFLSSGTVSNEEEIYDLYCSKCGGVLPSFPAPGDSVVCKWCGTYNTVR